MKLRLLLVLMATVVAACGSAAAASVTLVDPAEAQHLIESNPDLVVLDIRTPEEVAAGTLPRATVIDFYAPDFRDRLAALDRDATYLVYCRSGNRSEQATALMRDLGFTDVYELDGGIVSWVESGRTVVMP